MGQYYKIVNPDRKEYMRPLDFGDFSKMVEFAHPLGISFILSALALLLADGYGEGSGEVSSDDPIIGSWKKNRIVVTGDYADCDFEFETARPKAVWNEKRQSWENGELEGENNLYDIVEKENWKNVSTRIIVEMSYFHNFSNYIAKSLVCPNYRRAVPSAIVELAHQHKELCHAFGKADKDDNMENAMEAPYRFWRNIFPEYGVDYWKTINGIIKYHTRDKTINWA